jgi:magnesium-transporting ATPase (P-type)
MKRCPKCNVEYLDNTLEFCLEDGTRLVLSANQNPTTAKTAVLSDFPKHLPFEFETSKETILQNKDTDKLTHIKEKVTYQGFKIIEVAPIVLSLTHNYWQWLYLNKTNYNDTISFLTSSQFVVWLLLLMSGAISSFIALKFGKNKGFAIASLVILAINLLLSIVPNK